MIHELDTDLVHRLREKINSNNNFVKHFFINFKKHDREEGKDIWSKICSCVDWLDVAVEAIEKPRQCKSANYTTLEFTHFITTIDMILEAIDNLWTSIDVEHPLINDRSIFQKQGFDKKGCITDCSDKEYFKEIRAWFGIHSVNGNLTQINNFKHPVRFFSSWSYKSRWEEDTYCIRLYSNNSIAEEKYGGVKKINVNDLISFIALRYQTLSQFMEEIDAIYLKEKRRLYETPVEFNASESELIQLERLYQQAKDRRLTSEHYENEIQTYISFLKCNLNEFKDEEMLCVENYLSELKSIIPIYRDIIQNVDHSEFPVFEKLHLKSKVFSENYYHFIKTLEYAEADNMSGSNVISLNYLIEQGVLPQYSMNLTGSCLSLLIHALDFKHNKIVQR